MWVSVCTRMRRGDDPRGRSPLAQAAGSAEMPRLEAALASWRACARIGTRAALRCAKVGRAGRSSGSAHSHRSPIPPCSLGQPRLRARPTWRRGEPRLELLPNATLSQPSRLKRPSGTETGGEWGCRSCTQTLRSTRSRTAPVGSTRCAARVPSLALLLHARPPSLPETLRLCAWGCLTWGRGRRGPLAWAAATPQTPIGPRPVAPSPRRQTPRDG